jgi:hypothetical protein
MWNALHTRKEPTTKGVFDKLQEYSNQGMKIVICGHSLGGGYAVLCGLELLHMGVDIHAVVAHGAPQVIVPNSDSKLWCHLGGKTIAYVHGYDVVPRLPSCHKEWKDALQSLVAIEIKKKTRCFGCRSDGSLEKIGAWDAFEKVGAYRHVGKLMFIQMVENGRTKCQLVDANGQGGKDDEGWKILKTPPEFSGDFITKHTSKIYRDVLEAATKQRQEAE